MVALAGTSVHGKLVKSNAQFPTSVTLAGKASGPPTVGGVPIDVSVEMARNAFCWIEIRFVNE